MSLPSDQIDTATEQNYSVGQQESGWQLRHGSGPSDRLSGDLSQQRPSHPAVDILEDENDIWVFIDLPGFEEEEISVRTDQNALVVSADRQHETEEDRQVVLNERTTHVKRSIPLPISVKTDGAQASYEDGVCKVKLPKAAVDHYVEIPFE